LTVSVVTASAGITARPEDDLQVALRASSFEAGRRRPGTEMAQPHMAGWRSLRLPRRQDSGERHVRWISPLRT
jgi:hypothetical protein